MPKNSNSGFGIVSLIIPISIFSVLSYFGYSYFTNSKSGDVLQSSTVITGSPTPDSMNRLTNINRYLYQNLFGVADSNEFNKLNTPIILALNDSYDTCAFFPRSSRPLSFRFNVGGKSQIVRIYQNVTYQALPNSIKPTKYMVVSYNPTFKLTYRPTPNQLFFSCASPIGFSILIPQPSKPITASNFREFFEIQGLPTPRPSVTARPSVTVRPSVTARPSVTVTPRPSTAPRPSLVPTRINPTVTR